MKTGDDEQDLVLKDKEYGVWKAAQKGAAHILEDSGKLPGISAHALDQDIDRVPEATT